MKAQAPEDIYHLGIKALIRDGSGRVLLLKFNPAIVSGNVWDLPGGRVKRGETVKEALVREVSEELGPVKLTIGEHTDMILSNIRIPLDSGDVGLVLSVYQCTLPEGAEIVMSEDHDQFEWLAPQKAAELLLTKYPPEFCELVCKL